MQKTDSQQYFGDDEISGAYSSYYVDEDDPEDNVLRLKTCCSGCETYFFPSACFPVEKGVERHSAAKEMSIVKAAQEIKVAAVKTKAEVDFHTVTYGHDPG